MKLLRPYIPLEVRCRAALRQLGYHAHQMDRLIDINRTRPGAVTSYLASLLHRLREHLGAEKLHLDHDPALENRQKVRRKAGGEIIYYAPGANDPDFLIYREGGFKGSAHDIKTRVRGENGQFADNVIAKRARRRAKKIAQKNAPRSKNLRSPAPWPKGRKLQSRKLQQRNTVR